MKIGVATASGIEAVTKRELYKIIGKEDLAALDGRISFSGTWRDVAKCNLLLRTANRVEIVAGEFRAADFDELYEGISAIPWEDYIPENGNFTLSAKSVNCRLFAYSAIQSVSEKAICERLKKRYGVTELPKSGARYRIEVAGRKDFFTVSFNTSGEGLHRRGYRGLVGEAPLKETLAAALIELSVWNPDRPLVDLFCGSGTIPIEAAMIALGIPAGGKREFDFSSWSDECRQILDEEREKAISGIDEKKEIRISGFDIDEKQIRLARKHAELAGVDRFIHLQRADMRDFSSRFSHGVVISNPPYGERLLSRKEVEILYRDYGKKIASLDEWCAYTLTPVDDFERLFGKKADKKRKIYNGKLECVYYSMLAAPPKKREERGENGGTNENKSFRKDQNTKILPENE